ncbi:hypothetical protein F5B20DRAFT_519390 [Whalleya microplaca]|nr:hypothetical protein F5B20DRAFT_519390 [Whalleya microplaca]
MQELVAMPRDNTCRLFRQGKCHYGTRCKFSHDRAPPGSRQSVPESRTKVSTPEVSRQKPQRRGLQQQWNEFIRQASTGRYRQGREVIDRFFSIALQLTDSDINASQETIKSLATDGGLLYIRDVAERCAEAHQASVATPLWHSQLQPLFKLVIHPRIVDSPLLEQEVAIIYNFLVGIGGSRMKHIFDYVTNVLVSWDGALTQSGSKMSAVELSLGVLSKIIDCNTSNIINNLFSVVAERFSSMVQESVDISDEFPKLQAQKYLDYIRRRLGIGHTIKASQQKSTAPLNRAQFTLRRDLPGVLSADGPRHDNDHEDIANIQILPTESEIASAREVYLPTNDSSKFHIEGIRGRLDREFRLLHEDTVGQLRDKIRVTMEANRNASLGLGMPANRDIRIYNYGNPIVHDVQFGKHDGIELVIQIPQPVNRMKLQSRKQWWVQLKRLQSGGLVCILGETGSVLFFVVAQSTLRTSDDKRLVPRKKSKGPIDDAEETLSLADDDRFSFVNLKPIDVAPQALIDTLGWLRGSDLSHRRYLIEFPGVLLPSFFHTLESLQKMSQRPGLPFTDLIAPTSSNGGIMNVPPPQYATRADFSFDLSCLTDGNVPLSFSTRDATDPGKLAELSDLDRTQASALLDTLSRCLSLIQGPPGTGKSFTALKIIKVLLANKKKADLGPILCVCYTNHALDQLLEHALDDGVMQIVRIGSRSKSERLEKLNLRDIARNVERTRSEKHSLWVYETALDENEKNLGTILQSLRYCGSTSVLKNHLKNFHPQHHNILFGQDIDEDGYEIKNDRKRSLQNWLRGDVPSNSTARPIEDLLSARLSSMTQTERRKLHEYWLQEIRDPIANRIESETKSYTKNRKQRDNARNNIDLRCLQEADIVGITTTGLARNLDLLKKLRCKVMLCEEAGEVLEAHLLTALLPSVEHAILIGDHLQLRPQIQNYELHSTNPRGLQFSLDVSLFERLVNPPYASDARLPFSTLETQRRMHPDISKLIRATLYPALTDGENVKQYPGVMGMEQRLFWFHHEHLEASATSDAVDTSHVNEFEVELTTTLVSHLIRQGCYNSGDIAVLTPYLGQLYQLRRRMSTLFEITVNERDLEDLQSLERDGPNLEDPSPSSRHDASIIHSRKTTLLENVRVATVDNFQGEEAKVIIISLVRSNRQNRCGFLSTSNRINVLLSRAQHGMYIIGNSSTYGHVAMWSQVLSMLRDGGNFGTEFRLQCPRHPDIPILASDPEHFLRLSPEGGCNRRCDRRLDCGHTCISRCHSEVLHGAVKCLEPCPRPKKGCDHPCKLACGDKCQPRCNVLLENINITLPCGHTKSSALCWETQSPSTIDCNQIVSKVVPGCKHTVKAPCHIDVKDTKYRCSARCDDPRPCGHTCRSLCFQCKHREEGEIIGENHGICKQICDRNYTSCRHSCTSACHGDVPCRPCSAPCEVRCSHSVCSKSCHEPCAPCAEQHCASKCPHTQCTMPCAAPCDWVPCSKRCEKELDCGHQCPSLCGESCPDVKYCQKCCSEDVKDREVDFILGMLYHEIDLDEDPCIFPDCGHFLTKSNMDGLMDMKSHYEISTAGDPIAIIGSSSPFSMDEVKVCPTCRGSLRNIARYGRIVRRAILDETTKKFITWSTTEYIKLATRLLDEKGNLENAPVTELLDIDATKNKGRLSLAKSRAMQLNVIRDFVDQKRYKSICSLQQQISSFRNRVKREEQPLQRVADFVQHANRQQKTKGHFVFDESVIQVKGQLQAAVLLLKCESIMFLDFIRLYRQSKRKIEMKLDLSQYLKDCDTLIQSAEATDHPRQQVEGNVYFALFCAISRTLNAETTFISKGSSSASPQSRFDALKSDAMAHLEKARAIIATTPSTATLEPEVTDAQTFLQEGTFYSTVSADEMRSVYRAMAAEFSGTGHWYTCENNHPFTVGECGMPMQLARCPECGASVGGQNHRPAGGVRHATEVEELARDVGRLQI